MKLRKQGLKWSCFFKTSSALFIFQWQSLKPLFDVIRKEVGKIYILEFEFTTKIFLKISPLFTFFGLFLPTDISDKRLLA